VMDTFGDKVFVPLADTLNVGDSVAVYNLVDDTRIAVPILAFDIGDYAFVTPSFDFAGFDWKLDFDFNLIPLDFIYSNEDTVIGVQEMEIGGSGVWRSLSHIILQTMGDWCSFTSPFPYTYFAWRTMASDTNDGVAQVLFDDEVFTEENTYNVGTVWYVYEINKTQGFSAKIRSKTNADVTISKFAFFNDPDFDYESY